MTNIQPKIFTDIDESLLSEEPVFTGVEDLKRKFS